YPYWIDKQKPRDSELRHWLTSSVVLPGLCGRSLCGALHVCELGWRSSLHDCCCDLLSDSHPVRICRARVAQNQESTLPAHPCARRYRLRFLPRARREARRSSDLQKTGGWGSYRPQRKYLSPSPREWIQSLRMA